MGKLKKAASPVKTLLLVLLAVTSGMAEEEREITPLLWTRTAPQKVKAIIAQKAASCLQREVKNLQKQLEHELDHVQRCCTVDSQSLQQIQTAAAGAVTQATQPLYAQLIQDLEYIASAASPETAHQLLNVHEPSLEIEMPPQASAMWQQALEKYLGPEAFQQWKAVKDSRQKYQIQALTQILLIQLAESFALDEQQSKELEPLLFQVMETYYTDFKNCYRWGEAGSDALLLRHMPILVQGIPDEKLNKILKPRQLTDFTASAEENKSMWEYIVSQREVRLQKEKATAP